MSRLLLALLLLSAACSSTPRWLSLPAPTQQHGVEVVVDGARSISTMLSAITGKAVNRTGSALSRCTISFEAYDLHGARLGSARAERHDWPAGADWSFKADFPRYIENIRTISAPQILAIP